MLPTQSVIPLFQEQSQESLPEIRLTSGLCAHLLFIGDYSDWGTEAEARMEREMPNLQAGPSPLLLCSHPAEERCPALIRGEETIFRRLALPSGWRPAG